MLRPSYLLLSIGLIGTAGLLPVRSAEEIPACRLADAIPPAALRFHEKDDLLRRLNKQRLAAAVLVLDYRFKECAVGNGGEELVFKAMGWVVDAASDVLPSAADRQAVLEAAAQTARDVEAVDRRQVTAGKCAEFVLAATEYERARAELRALQFKREIERAKK